MRTETAWETLRQIAEENKDQIIGLSTYLHQHPELSLQEYGSCAYLTEILRQHGFSVTTPYCGMDTAFRAELRRGEGARVAFMAEYDALPGYGPEKRPAHACGHNWIAAVSVGAAIVLSQSPDWQGTLVVLGTPAEETVGGKAVLAREGAFRDLDAAYEMHLHESDSMIPRALAIDAWEFSFRGKASHASSAPHRGINALDAVNLTFAGINALRQQLRPDVRVHGIVTDGGMAPNIIPETAACRFYVRCRERAYLNEVSERVKNCARGAALMTGAELEIHQFENSFDDLNLNPVLSERMEALLLQAGMGPFDPSEPQPGSTDVGNVSHLLPVFYGYAGVGDGNVRPHEAGFIELANGAEARRKAVSCALATAYSAWELFTQPELLQKVKDAFCEDA